MKVGHFCLPTYFPDVDGSLGQLMRRWLALLRESDTLGIDSLGRTSIIFRRLWRHHPVFARHSRCAVSYTQTC